MYDWGGRYTKLSGVVLMALQSKTFFTIDPTLIFWHLTLSILGEDTRSIPMPRLSSLHL